MTEIVWRSAGLSSHLLFKELKLTETNSSTYGWTELSNRIEFSDWTELSGLNVIIFMYMVYTCAKLENILVIDKPYRWVELPVKIICHFFVNWVSWYCSATQNYPNGEGRLCDLILKHIPSLIICIILVDSGSPSGGSTDWYEYSILDRTSRFQRFIVFCVQNHPG